MDTKKADFIGIMSDSHDNRDAMKKAVSLFNSLSCGLVIHAGDFVAPFSAGELKKLNCPVKAVFGNCDGEKEGLANTLAGWGEIQTEPICFEWRGLNFLLTHTDSRLHDFLNSGNYDVIIFGHTHKPEIRQEGHCLVVNPGETGGWLAGKKTVAFLDAENRRAEIIPLD